MLKKCRILFIFILLFFISYVSAISLHLGEKTSIDIDNDGVDDLVLKLISIDKASKTALIERTIIQRGIYDYVYYDYDLKKDTSKDINSDINNLNTRKGVPEWVLKLPTRPEASENFDCANECPCGPSALYDAFRDLGDVISPCEINKQRQGGFRRWFLSLFNKEAQEITWPSEIIKIAKNYGYEVEVIKGKKATLEKIREKTTENSVVIIRDFDKGHPLTTQHYETYDVNLIKKTYASGATNIGKDPIITDNVVIEEIYVIKKKSI